MNSFEYRRRKKELEQQAPQYRILCVKCIQPDFSCYCKTVQPIHCPINFVILIHPIEAKRRIATGRMSHLCLESSHLINGQDFSENKQVNNLLEDPNYFSVLLYPGPNSTNLSELSEEKRNDFFQTDRKLRIFVVDGTWATARRTVRQSINLNKLPRISFRSSKTSNFRVRKQPKPHFFSTIEAIHQTIELLAPCKIGADIVRSHDHLLEVFNGMVEKQLTFMNEAKLNLRRVSYRKPA